MDQNERVKVLLKQCSFIVKRLLENGYLAESLNQHKFEQLKKILEEQEKKKEESGKGK
ncbi:MAG: hypothetical protein H7259_00365 [Cytophagales bacterium]|nr:hypothetical protein [Cytophaga sp.]